LTQAKNFDQFYRAHAPSAFRRAQRIMRSDADAHEIVHDVFLALFERADANCESSAYLYGAITHACLNRLRSQRTRQRLLEHKLVHLSLSRDPGTRAESELGLRDALARMPEILGQVAVYLYLDELSQRDIARVLGCSRQKVGELVARLERWAEREEKQSCQL
jgi:RNA polymerase sigma-70 factor (ECF subfamily)